jgi:hypothetical protein
MITDKFTIEYNQEDNTYTYKHTTEGEYHEETVSPDEIMLVLSGHYHLNRGEDEVSEEHRGTPDEIFNASTYLHGRTALFDPHVTEQNLSLPILLRATVAQLGFVEHILNDLDIMATITGMTLHAAAKLLDQMAWDIMQHEEAEAAEANGNEVVGQGEVESSPLN